MNKRPFQEKGKDNTTPFVHDRNKFDNFLGIGEGKRAEAKAHADIEKARIAAEAATQLNNIEIARQQGELAAKQTAALAAATKAAAGPSITTIMLYVGGGIVLLLAVVYFIKKRKK
jgi:LPXTG-motif cell wall-anchored protein